MSRCGKDIVVWFSGGVPSAVALKLTVDKYGKHRVRAVNTPIKDEHPDNTRFLNDVSAWTGVEIETAINPDYPDSSAEFVWKERKFMSGIRGAAPCTKTLKKFARAHWENNNHADWHVLGFTLEERKRHERFCMYERNNVLPILIDAGMTREDCARFIGRAGIRISEMYRLGFPNANCMGCVKATSPTYWNLVRQVDPETFEKRATLSRELGVKLTRVKSERMYLDELDPNVKGNRLKVMPDCGIFCEEPEIGNE